MAELSQRDKFDLKRAYMDAKAKVDDLPGRMKDEFQQAEAEQREPFAIEPLTEIPPKLVVYAIDHITGSVPKELSDIMAVQRRSCSIHREEKQVLLLSEQLKMILDAAGLGEQKAPASKKDSDALVP